MNKYIDLIKKLVAENKTDFEIVKAVLRAYDIHPGTCPACRKGDKESMQFILDDVAIVRKNRK